MNLRLTKKQTADYIQAILTASTTEERKQAHYQYGQLDEVQKILEVEQELRRQQHYQDMQLIMLLASHYQDMQLIRSKIQNSFGNSLANQMLNAANQANSLQSYGYVPVTTQQQPSIWQQAKNWLKGEQQ